MVRHGVIKEAETLSLERPVHRYCLRRADVVPTARCVTALQKLDYHARSDDAIKPHQIKSLHFAGELSKSAFAHDI